MCSKMEWKIDSTLSYSAYLNLLQCIEGFQMISSQRNKNTQRKNYSNKLHIIPWSKMDQNNCWENINILGHHSFDINLASEYGRISIVFYGGLYD